MLKKFFSACFYTTILVVGMVCPILLSVYFNPGFLLLYIPIVAIAVVWQGYNDFD